MTSAECPSSPIDTTCKSRICDIWLNSNLSIFICPDGRHVTAVPHKKLKKERKKKKQSKRESNFLTILFGLFTPPLNPKKCLNALHANIRLARRRYAELRAGLWRCSLGSVIISPDWHTIPGRRGPGKRCEIIPSILHLLMSYELFWPLGHAACVKRWQGEEELMLHWRLHCLVGM